MPCELRPEGRLVIRLNSLDRERKFLPDLIYEFYGSLRVVVIVDAQYVETCSLVDGGELIEALTRSAYTGERISHRAALSDRKIEGGASPGLRPGRYFFNEIRPT